MKKLVITLVSVLAVFGLLLAADFGAAAAAEYQVSKNMRERMSLSEDPEVRFNGFPAPFLYQAVTGDYRDVGISARAVRVGELSEVGVEANLLHARVPLSDVINQNIDEIHADEVHGRVRLKASDIGRMLHITDLRIAPAPKDALNDLDEDDPGGDESGSGADSTTPDSQNCVEDGAAPCGTVDRTKTTAALDGSVNIAGSQNKVHVIAVLSLLNGKLKVEPRKLDLNNSVLGPIPLPKMFEKSVLHQFSTTLDPGAMPFAVTPTGVSAEQGALVVDGTAKDVTLGPNGMTTG